VLLFFFFQAEDGIRDRNVTGVQTCALPICKICNDPDITLNEEIYQSELRTGDINRSLAYYLKAKEVLTNDVTLSLGTYFKQCLRSEERRVGKECRSWWLTEHSKERRIVDRG